MIILSYIKVECTLHDAYEQIALSTSVSNLGENSYYNFVFARKVCTNAKNHCQVTDSELTAIHGSKLFLYRQGNYTGSAATLKVGGVLGNLIPNILKGATGEVPSIVLSLAGTNYYYAALVHNLSLVKKLANDFTIFKFEVRVVLGKNATSAAAVVKKLGEDQSFGNLITPPYQVITGNSITNVAKSEANTDLSNPCIQVTTSASATYEISNSEYWFAPTSNLLDTTIVSISRNTCITNISK